MNSVIQHVEVHVQNNCMMDYNQIETMCRDAIKSIVSLETVVIEDFQAFPELSSIVKKITICCEDSDRPICPGEESIFKFHLYETHSDGPSNLDLDMGQAQDAAAHWYLPCTEFVDLWESLVFDNKIKSELLKYVSSTIVFSERNVNQKFIPWNKMVLLHGPPGTGKTSLCKALAQKLAIRFQDKFVDTSLVEINCHSLFSKWFSESGKLVSSMFQRIEELITQTNTFVVILIDEVESLAHCRKAAFSGNAEPSDSIRVVNALLTQLDHIRRHPNILILTTSNITEAIDVAMIDRADIKRFIGLPSSKAVYKMLLSCIGELQQAGIINTREKLFHWGELEMLNCSGDIAAEPSLCLKRIAEQCVGCSGRMIRKFPLLAHAFHLEEELISLEIFLAALAKTVFEEKENRNMSSILTGIQEL